MDKELGAARKERWNKAFAEDVELEDENTENIINRKATIVIEHLIQASDIAHTMLVIALMCILSRLSIIHTNLAIPPGKFLGNTGTFISTGTRSCLWRCTKPTKMADLRKIPPLDGKLEILVSILRSH